MELEGKIAVITNVLNRSGLSLAARLMSEGCCVIISDEKKSQLSVAAKELGLTGIAANIEVCEGAKSLVEKVIRKFGRIDIFICHYSRQNHAIFSADNGSNCWHSRVMSQMYIAKFLLPHMCNTGGYFITAIPASGLSEEFHVPVYNTTKHEALLLAERLADNYRNRNIKVGAICYDEFAASELPLTEGPYSNCSEDGFVNRVIHGMIKEQFMIASKRFSQAA